MKTGWKLAVLTSAVLMVGVVSAPAITISGYTADEHNRFSSGFPTSPVQNTHSSFVGADYDWSGVAWSTTTYVSSSYKGFGMLSPLHFLAARHYEQNNEETEGVRILNTDGEAATRSVSSVEDTGYGLKDPSQGFAEPDIAIGVLGAPFFPGEMARYGVLDLHASSTPDSTANYTGLDIFLYGRAGTMNGSPRTGGAVTSQVGYYNDEPNQGVLLTTHEDITLQGGDSGSPGLVGWQNPDGGNELTVVGVNSAVGSNTNFLSWLAYSGAMAGANSVMNQEGFALRVVGNPSAIWEGGGGPQGANYVREANWSSPATPSDVYVLFDAASDGVLSITMNEAGNARGLYFKSTATANDGFTIGGANTLTIGRGGVTNYDADRQTFNAYIALGAPQYWSAGPGGITAANINTQGRLLEIAGGAAAVEITGTISGSGAIALTGGTLNLSGQSSYTGVTWVHAGTLRVQAGADISSSSMVYVREEGSLAGIGTVGLVAGSGTIDPGNSPGILTAEAVDPTGGLGFNFEFTTASPNYGSAANSLNDVLRLTDTVAPFIDDLTAANVVGIYLDAGAFEIDDTFRGGFFTDSNVSFLDSIQYATFAYYVATVGGSVSYGDTDYAPYAGPLAFEVDTVEETADFGDGLVSGRVMQITVIPEPSTLLFAVLALVGLRMYRPVRKHHRPIP